MKYNIEAKPTKNYASKLESKIADWLSYSKIPYIYEPKTYLTEKGNYTPDFYLPLINTYIEVKPKIITFINSNYFALLEAFVIKEKTDLIILTGTNELLYYDLSSYLKNGPCVDTSGYIAKCSMCKTVFLTSQEGSYHCRHCGYHNGDHDIIDNLEDNILNYLKVIK
jgi:hypothetical protein